MTARSIFRSAAFGVNGAASRSLGKPAAMFPGAIATDAQLAIAVDRQQTTLALPMNVTDTSMTVADPSSITAYNLLSIDNEIVKTTGPPSGNIVPVARGFDGTTPAVHLTSATVSGFVDAWHHNALVAEIEAIENALGPNLNKLPGAIYFPVPVYNFAPQSPGGALTVGNNVITLAPVPMGVNGTDQNHYLYVSGGTGTAEAVLITGGTAVEGATSATLIINCANAHSGAWTIASATAGVAETVQHASALYPQGFFAWMGAGAFNFYAPVRVATNGVKVRGMGYNATAITVVPANTSAFQFISPSGMGYLNGLSDLSIGGNNASTSGYAITTNPQSNFSLERMVVQSFFNGLHLTSLIEGFLRDVYMTYMLGGDGVLIDGSQTNIVFFDNVNVQGTAAYNSGFNIVQSGNCLFAHCTTLAANYGMILAPTTGVVASIDVNMCYFDQAKNAGILFAPAAGTGIARCSFTQCWMCSGGVFGVAFQASTGTTKGIRFIACEISDNANNGFQIPAGVTADDIELIGCSITNNHTASGVAVDGTDPNVSLRILGCAIGNGFGGWGAGTQVNGISMGPSGNLCCVGNTIAGNTGSAIVLPATSAQNHVIENNQGIDDVPPTIASAAAIQLPPNRVINVTGTTTITTLSGYWNSRSIVLVKTDAGTLTVGGGGNIPVAHTLSQWGSLRLTFSASNWL